MPRRLRCQRGLATFDVLIATLLIALASTLLIHSLARAPHRRQENVLREQLELVRSAVQKYHADHGFYPGSSSDWGYPLSDAQLQQKLSQYTDLRGVPSPTSSHRFRLGPYLMDFPAEPFGSSSHLDWALQEHRSAQELAQSVAKGQGAGGWFYAPETGTILANLGRSFPGQLASF